MKNTQYNVIAKKDGDLVAIKYGLTMGAPEHQKRAWMQYGCNVIVDGCSKIVMPDEVEIEGVNA